jgi:acyl-CoA dehydrogenase
MDQSASSAAAALAPSCPPNPLLDFAFSGAISVDALTAAAVVAPYTAAHQSFRAQVRAFVQRHLTPAVVARCEAEACAPRELLQASYAAGLYSLRAPVSLGGTPPPGWSSSDSAAAGDESPTFDLLFDVVMVQELARCGAMGLATELMGSFGMVLPLLQTFAPEHLQRKLLKPMVQAQVMVCFAVTEPPPPSPPPSVSAEAKKKKQTGAKSAPAAAAPFTRQGLRTTATLSSDGKSYEVNGTKLYISFGVRSDYILTAVQILPPTPPPPGASTAEEPEPIVPSMSLLLIPRATAGVFVDNMPLSGWRSTSTTRIRFERVRIDVADSLVVDGSAASGFEVPRQLARLMRANVSRERFVTAVLAAASARVCLDDAVSFARGKVLSVDPRSGRRKLLIHSDAVREQLVVLAARVAQAEALVEKVALQLSAPHMREEFSSSTSAATAAAAAESDQAASARRQRALQCALLKHACSEVLNLAVSTASSVLGAAALPEGGTGPGARVERIRRDAPVNAAAGGGEHTLLAFVAKQAKL